MSNTKTVWVAVSVTVPDNFNEKTVAEFLEKFIQIGENDLSNSITEFDIEVSEEEEQFATKAKWGDAVVLPCKPIGI